MADVTLRVRLATEEADRDAARFRDRLTAGLKSANESLDRIGKTQAFTGLVLAGELFAKAAELGAKAVKAIATGIADATTAAVDAGKASATFVRGLEAAERSSQRMVEAFGEAVSRSGAVQGGLQAIDEAARSLTDFLDSPEGRGAVDDFFRALSAGAAGAINAVLGARSAFNDLADFLDRRAVAWGLKDAIAEPLNIEEPAWVRTAQQLADRLAGVGTAPRRVDTGSRGRRTPAIGSGGDAAGAFEASVRGEIELEEKLRASELARQEEHRAEMLAVDQAYYASVAGMADEHGSRLQAQAREQMEAERRRQDETTEQMRLALERRQQDVEQFGGMITGAAEAIGSTLSAGLLAALSGEDVGAALRQAFGAAIVSMGTLMIQTGILATIIGPIRGLLGDPSGWIAAGLGAGAIVAGGAMVLAGRAMGGGAGPGGASAVGAGASGGTRGGMAGSLASSAPAGFQATPAREMPPAVTVVVQGAIVGSAAELGRYVERALAASGRLRVGAT